jgi:1-acyl-sn-glycerol-3-phosphate acyltransferase
MKSVFKALLLFLMIFLFIIISVLLKLIFLFSSNRGKTSVAYMTYLFGKIITLLLGVKVEISGRKELLKKKGMLLVCNHLSYLDGVVATHLLPLAFIGRVDMKKWPLFGLFTFLSNTIFINRNNASDIPQELKQVVSFLKAGINVILFPEGTSSNGTKLLPFKSSFFAAPLEAKAPIIPLAIKYRKINGQDINENNKDLVYWYGDMVLFTHLLKVCTLSSIELSVHIGEPIYTATLPEPNPVLQRKVLCEACRKAIENYL